MSEKTRARHTKRAGRTTCDEKFKVKSSKLKNMFCSQPKRNTFIMVVFTVCANFLVLGVKITIISSVSVSPAIIFQIIQKHLELV